VWGRKKGSSKQEGVLDVVRIQVEKRGSKKGEKEGVLCCRRRDSDSRVVELLVGGMTTRLIRQLEIKLH
jgi:hypothetical protein